MQKIRFLYILFYAFLPFQDAKVSPKDKNKIQLDGDLIFGGLFPMHEKGKSGKSCGTIDPLVVTDGVVPNDGVVIFSDGVPF